jgi:hypothetical protein
MADIDSIISGASGNTRYDFSTFGDPVKSYFDAKDQRAKNDLREAFKGGVPTLPDGSIDYATMQKTLYQKGGLEQGNALSGISARAGELEALRGADGSQPTVGPSTSRNTVTPDPGKRMDAQPQQAAAPGGPAQGQPTVMNVVAAQGFPNTELQKISESIARQLGVDPTAPLNLQDPQVRNVLAPAIAQFKRMNLGQVQPPQAGPAQGAPPVMAQAQAQPQAAPQGFQPPPNVVAAQNDPVLKRLTLLAASQDKQIAAAAKTRLESYLKDRELTGPLKEYQAATKQGFKGTFEDWQNRADENTTERDILTKSLLPKIDKSQETAVAARDDITAIHRSREELDQNGGVFSGAFADKKLYLAKVAEALGVPDAGAIKNTEAYGAAIGSRVASMVKAFGSGTAISDGDRRFAAAMAGGQVTLDEKSMRRILDIGEQAARGKIEQHNTLADKIVGANKAMKDARDTYIVQSPGAYKKPEATKTAAPASTIASKADYDKLPTGAVFTGPDGKQWRKQ